MTNELELRWSKAPEGIVVRWWMLDGRMLETARK